MKKRLSVVLALAVLAAASSFATRDQWPWARWSDVPTASPVFVTSAYRVVSDTLQRGETVSTLLERQGVTGLNLASLTNALRFDPRRIKAGLIFSVRRDAATDEPTQVEFRSSRDQRLQFVRTAAGEWRANAVAIHWSIDTIRIANTIQSNLYDALDNEMSQTTLDRQERLRMAWELAEVNESSVDFSNDIQPGDRFTTVIERLTSEDGEVRFGRLLASELSVSGKLVNAYHFVGEDGKEGFYDAQGNSVRRAFLLTPVEFKYVSSGFSRARKHPILGILRRHEGIDFSADRGRPVRAASDGVVSVAGWSGGYGNLVEIRHANGITTRYAHLKDFAVRRGERVGQGETIGHVGATGLATAPHLHYEFRVNGVAQNPRSVRMDSGRPLPASLLPSFQQSRGALAELLSGRSTAAALATE